ncbi:CHAD domain-containing protein [Ensifer sp. ENS06]|nr:CHAD domain-containing protein [Ensifer sp. ENS06]
MALDAPAELRDRSVNFAEAVLDHERRKMKNHGRALTKVRDEERHEARKDAKKLRYAAEFSAVLFGNKRFTARSPTPAGPPVSDHRLRLIQNRIPFFDFRVEALIGLQIVLENTVIGNRAEIALCRLDQRGDLLMCLPDVLAFATNVEGGKYAVLAL